jgi:hypothetical protein
VEARIRFAAGQVDQAARQLKIALDTVAAQDFRPYQGTPTVLGDVAAAANVFAYQGDLTSAAKALDFAEQVRREVVQHASGEPKRAYGRVLAPGDAGRSLLGDRGAGLVAPPGVAERRRGRPDGEPGEAQASGPQRRVRRHRPLHRPGRRQQRLVEYRTMSGDPSRARSAPCWR